MGSTEQNLRRWWLIVAALVTLVLAVAGAFAWRLLGELRATHEHASYARAEALREAEAMGIAIYMRSANARGYLLSGDRAFLEARKTARVEVARLLPRLLATDDAAARQAAEALADLIERHDAVAEHALGLYARSPERARAEWDERTRPLQAQIEPHVHALIAAHRARFDEARRAADATSVNARRLLFALLVAIAIVVLVLTYAVARAIRSLVARLEYEQQQVTFRLIEQVPVGIFVIRPDGRPYYANQHAKKLFGRDIVPSRTEIAKTYHCYEAGTDRLYAEDRLPIKRALAGETSEVTDIELRRDDDVIPLHVVAAPVHDANGALIYAVSGFQDVRQLQRLALRDALTGLANRAAVHQMFAREHVATQRGARPFTLALIDLDHFKSINDTHGHAKGDEVLRTIASLLLATFRRSDVVGRWGGEELVVLMPDSDLAAATRALERALELTREHVFDGRDGMRFSATFSAGVVDVRADDNLDTVLDRADQRLYAAKQAGRNQIVTH